jgi:hypothetical protein
MSGLVGQVQVATAGLSANGLPIVVRVGTEWPPQNVLQDVARSAPVPPPPTSGTTPAPTSITAAISVYDRKVGRNATRWSQSIVSTTVVPATLMSAVEAPAAVAPSGSTTITLSGVPTIGDGVSAVAQTAAAPGSIGPVMAAVVAQAVADDTASSMASKLAAAVNADATLSTWFRATAAGPVVTMTNRLGVQATLASYTGNGGSQVVEIGRRDRQIQVACWVPTLEARDALVRPLETLFAQLNLEFMTLPDGTSVQVMYETDYDLDDDTLSDVYRHDFLVDVEYPVTSIDQLFAIIAPVGAFQGSY